MRVRVLGPAPLLVAMLALVACYSSAGDADGGGSEGPVVGSEAPRFSLEASAGETVSLADFAGRRPVLLYFSMGPG